MSIDISTDIWKHYYKLMCKMNDGIAYIESHNDEPEKQVDFYDKLFKDIADFQMFFD